MNKLRKNRKRIQAVMLFVVCLLLLVAFASVAGAEPVTIDVTGFDLEEAFGTTNTLLTSLMPLAMIAFGLALAFVVLRFIRSMI